MAYEALVFVLLLSMSWQNCKASNEGFLECMSVHTAGYIKESKLLHRQNSSSYSYLLQSAEQNPRWLNSTSRKPQYIVTPSKEFEIQAAILCSRKHGIQIRVKSGGHDYEGLSYLCNTPFVMIDLVNFRSISFNWDDETAWVQSGATLGELYYAIAHKSRVHGFPAGICPSVGVGGHFSGGGISTMSRKHGLAADNIIDAYLIDVHGRILDRNAMGEDLFWAIRGGGAASFGVIVAWKIKLVLVPSVVTVFTIQKQLDEGGTKLFYKWQHIAPKLPPEIFIRVVIQAADGQNQGDNRTVVASFEAHFLGPKDQLFALVNNRFPELDLQLEDCTEMSWIESVIYFAFQKVQPWEILLNRIVQYKSNFKAKSDFAVKPIPMRAMKGIWERFLQEQIAYMIVEPFGGKMDEISESEIPFPHRKGNLFNIQYLVKWEDSGTKHLDWINELYEYMKPYVSHSPRSAYINYRDLDIGKTVQVNSSYLQATIWGNKYFKGNFKRLTQVKSKVDPGNFFRNEQSIPRFN